MGWTGDSFLDSYHGFLGSEIVDMDGDKGPQDHFLGLSTAELAGVQVQELLNNETAIKMVVHYYKRMADDLTALSNERNTYKGIVESYERNRTRLVVGTILLTLSNVFVGFGVNLLTAEKTGPGFSVFVPGIAMALAGLYLSLARQR